MTRDKALSSNDQFVLTLLGAAGGVAAWVKRQELWHWLTDVAARHQVLAVDAAVPLPAAGGLGFDAARLAVMVGFCITVTSLAIRLRGRKDPVSPRVPIER